MMMRILMITDRPAGDVGIEIDPGRTVTAITDQRGLGHMTQGRVYDLIFVDQALTLTERQFAKCADCLAPWGYMVTFQGFRSNPATLESN